MRENIIERKGFDEIIRDSGKLNLNYDDAFMFVYGTNEEDRSVFALMNPKIFYSNCLDWSK